MKPNGDDDREKGRFVYGDPDGGISCKKGVNRGNEVELIENDNKEKKHKGLPPTLAIARPMAMQET